MSDTSRGTIGPAEFLVKATGPDCKRVKVGDVVQAQPGVGLEVFDGSTLECRLVSEENLLGLVVDG